MRIHVSFIDRVGITQEVLALLVGRNLNLDAVEMVPPNVYLDAPALSFTVFDELREALLQVRGVQTVTVVDILPGQRRSLQLDALLAAMSDPVLAVDRDGLVLLANPALQQLCEEPPEGRPLAELFDDPALATQLLEQGFRLPLSEVTLRGQALLLDAMPIHENDTLTGALLTLYPPNRIGGRLAALHHDHAEGFDALIGDSQPVRALKARALRVAALDAPLLIHGETGTGKELVARACHAASARCDQPFLALNCAALPESLAESELFGYAPGAFTGAQRGGKPGLLELAHQGTVFLDEIGEMSPYLQAKLLRFLSDGCFRRIGGDREVKVDVRILSATHRDLEKMVGEGSFREDLFYRLNVLNLEVPPLRERGQDILQLARHFMRQACTQIQRPPCRLAPEAFPALLGNRWPGNVRQLQNVIFRSAAVCEGTRVELADLDIAGTAVARPGSGEIGSLEEAVEGFEKDLLSRLYGSYPSTRQLAARLCTSHSAIAIRLRKYGIPAKA
ncbi:sigma-54-dependent transcriptional regulator [Pseudomonas sp. QL9]|uniref:sigma-54-dependent transcriptional regulator n=1 Tax=Pseudomonas sp. QL9 TaxID=3242725 RepID=UPI00352BCEA1